jgi:ATP-binding cassette subfamily B protein
MRFSDPARGRVLIDGMDLRDLTLASLRAEIGLVPQDAFIFDASLRENIAIGRPDATEAEIRSAARAAHLDSYIEALPLGYETMLGERGVRMSGGQRQRLAIARAVLRDPSVLVLDEGTGALDSETERGIIATLDTLRPGRTTILVTHRLALAATADCVVVLDHGRVVAQGMHDELMRAGGLYCRLWRGTDAPAGRLD